MSQNRLYTGQGAKTSTLFAAYWLLSLCEVSENQGEKAKAVQSLNIPVNTLMKINYY